MLAKYALGAAMALAVSTAFAGTVSSVGKEANVIQMEQEFLRSRELQKQQEQAQLDQQYAAYYQQQNQLQGQCAALESQIRANEIQQRQINAWQMMEQLKQAHRALRDQQYRLGCHR